MQKKQAILSLILVLAILLVTISAAMAQAPTATPPTWKPPEIYKNANDRRLRVGDPVQFTIIVVNPGDPSTDAAWYNVRVVDQIDPVLRIDGATSTRGTVTITGQTVVVNGSITLNPGEQFVVTIDCTLIGPATPGQTIINEATLEYTDDQGDPQEPIDVEEPVVITIEEEVPPVIPEASTLILLGSAASGLAGYVGLQMRARRRKRS